MIIVTTNRITGKRIVRTLGLVRGNTIRARHIGKDIMAVFRNIVGGEVSEYTKLLAESREQALDRMVERGVRSGGERHHLVALLDLDDHGRGGRAAGLRDGRRGGGRGRRGVVVSIAGLVLVALAAAALLGVVGVWALWRIVRK